MIRTPQVNAEIQARLLAEMTAKMKIALDEIAPMVAAKMVQWDRIHGGQGATETPAMVFRWCEAVMWQYLSLIEFAEGRNVLWGWDEQQGSPLMTYVSDPAEEAIYREEYEEYLGDGSDTKWPRVAFMLQQQLDGEK